MRRHAKASSAGSTYGSGNSRSLIRRAFVTRGIRGDAKGTGARSLRRVLSSLAVMALAFTAFFVASALGSQTHLYTGTSFGPDGSTGSRFQKAGALAHDSAGNVYLAEIGQDLIEKFSASGPPLDFAATPGSNQIAGIDFRFAAGESQLAVAQGSGAIYATSFNSILAFAASGEPLEFTAGPNPGTNEISGFNELLGVAIDANGVIYAGDYKGSYGPENISGGVAVYGPTGELLSTFQSPQAGNLAVDSSGNVYVAAYSGHVTRFEPSSFPVTGSTTYLESGVIDPAISYSVAVNSASDDLYVTHGNRIAQYTSAGVEVSILPGPATGLLTGSLGVTSIGTGAGEKVYASDTDGAGQVRVFGPLATAADATTTEATEIANTSAKLNGTVNPDGTEASYQFEYGTTTDYGELSPPVPSPVGNDNTDHAVETQLSDLEPNTLYHYRLNAINSAGSNSGEDRTFRTSGPADVETTGSLVRTTTTALLEGRVNPQDKATSYYFEYGAAGPCDSAACTKTDPFDAGEGEEIVFVAERASGLAPATTYHYRLVADNGNSAGPGIGEDMTVTTRAGEAAPTHGSFAGPPGSDRAWEQVNAPDTGGHSVDEIKAISDDGERVVYNVRGGTPDTTFGSLNTPLVAERSAAGWQSQNVLPPQQAESGKEQGWFKLAASNDLSRLIAERDRSTSKSLWSLSPAGQSAQIYTSPDGASINFYTMSEDGSRVVAAPTVEHGNLYDVTSETPKLISLLPDETVPSCGVTGVPVPVAFQLPPNPSAAARWVSADGSLAFFPSQGDECGGDSQLYVRDLESEVTRRISPPPIAGPECSAAFIKSTADAAYFWSISRLTADDRFTPNCDAITGSGAIRGGDVYRYDLSDETVDCLTCISDQPAEVEMNSVNMNAGAFSAIAVADDESRIYFTSTKPLVPGAAVRGIYRLRTVSGDLRYVAPGEEASARGGNVGQSAFAYQAMTPDGSTIVFRSSQFGLNPVGGLDNGGNTQYYLYDDDSGALTCATCVQDGSPSSGDVLLSSPAAGGLVTAEYPYALGPNLTPLSASGEVFAFATPTSLVGQDQNAAKAGENPVAGSDTYEWRDGRLLLISDGTSNWPGNQAEFAAPKIAGVSRSGRDVYFTIAAQLTPDALESAPRLYDARIGGGFAFSKAPPPCPLEVCQGTPSAPPVQPAPGSAEFSGPGNPKPVKQKKAKKKQRKHKKRSSQKKRGASRSGHDGNRASHDRRTSR